jgi:hypothetical protein
MAGAVLAGLGIGAVVVLVALAAAGLLLWLEGR